jgi:hypothetical protein
LSLIINAIVVWNTRHFDRAQAKLLEQGEQVEDSVWQHLSPLAWKHINLVGSYHFSDVHLEEEFRPLREVESRRTRRGSTSGTFAKAQTLLSKQPEMDEEKLPRQLSWLEEHQDEERA